MATDDYESYETVIDDGPIDLRFVHFKVETDEGETKDIHSVRSDARRLVMRIVKALRELDALIVSYQTYIMALSAKRMKHLDSTNRKSGQNKALQVSMKMDFVEEKRIKPLRSMRTRMLNEIAKPWDVYTARKGTGKFIAAWFETNGNLLKAMKKSGVDPEIAKSALEELHDFFAYSEKLKRKRLRTWASKHRASKGMRGGPTREITYQELWWLEDQSGKHEDDTDTTIE